MAIVASLDVVLSANTARFEAGLTRAQRLMRSTRASVSNLANSAAGLTVALTGVAGVTGLAANSIRLAAEAEQSAVAFRTLIGDAQLATKVLEDIEGLAARTPFRFDDLRNAGQMLAAFNISAERIAPTLKMLGDISAGTNNRIEEIAELFGKAKVQGRLFGEDINQLTGRGIPVISALADTMGVAESQVKSLVSEGSVGFQELEAAMISLVQGEGAKFGGLMEAQSQTAAGAFSTLRDNIDSLQREIGKTAIETLNLTEGLQHMSSSIDGLGDKLIINLAGFRAGFNEELKGFVNDLDQFFLQVPNALAGPGGIFDDVDRWITRVIGEGVEALGLESQGLKRLRENPQAEFQKIETPLSVYVDELEKAINADRMRVAEARKRLAAPDGSNEIPNLTPELGNGGSTDPLNGLLKGVTKDPFDALFGDTSDLSNELLDPFGETAEVVAGVIKDRIAELEKDGKDSIEMEPAALEAGTAAAFDAFVKAQDVTADEKARQQRDKLIAENKKLRKEFSKLFGPGTDRLLVFAGKGF